MPKIAAGESGTGCRCPCFTINRFWLLALAGSRHAESPTSSTRRKVSGSRSRKPLGPQSTEYPPTRSVPIVPPSLLLASQSSQPSGRPASPSQCATERPEIPPPTINPSRRGNGSLLDDGSELVNDCSTLISPAGRMKLIKNLHFSTFCTGRAEPFI